MWSRLALYETSIPETAQKIFLLSSVILEKSLTKILVSEKRTDGQSLSSISPGIRVRKGTQYLWLIVTGNKTLLSNGGDRKGSPVSCHENRKKKCSLMAYAQGSLTGYECRAKGKILHLPAIVMSLH